MSWAANVGSGSPIAELSFLLTGPFEAGESCWRISSSFVGELVNLPLPECLLVISWCRCWRRGVIHVLSVAILRLLSSHSLSASWVVKTPCCGGLMSPVTSRLPAVVRHCVYCATIHLSGQTMPPTMLLFYPHLVICYWTPYCSPLGGAILRTATRH